MLTKKRVVKNNLSDKAPIPIITNDFSVLSFTESTLTTVQLLLSIPDPATFGIDYAPAGISVTSGGLLSATPVSPGPHRVGIIFTLTSGASYRQELYFLVSPAVIPLPATPTGLNLTWDETNNRFALSFTPQGAEVVGYEISYSLNGTAFSSVFQFGTGQPILLPSNAPPLNLQFANADRFTVNLRSVNVAGLKSLSASASATVSFSEIQAPPELTGGPGDGVIIVNWSNPVGTPANAIVQISVRTESQQPITYESPRATGTYTVPNVIPGVVYLISARYRIPGTPDTFSAFTLEIPISGQASEVTVERTFTASTAFFPKPNDGIVHDIGFKSTLTEAELAPIKSAGFRTVLWCIDISSARLQATFPTQLKTDIAAGFAALRASGMKAIVRPAYTTQVQVSTYSPSLANTLSHVDEFAAIISANASLISLVQCGFVGVEGLEGSFGSYAEDTYGIETPAARTQIYDKMLSVYSPSVFILSRRFKYTSSLDDVPIDPGPGTTVSKSFTLASSGILYPGAGIIRSTGFTRVFNFTGMRTNGWAPGKGFGSVRVMFNLTGYNTIATLPQSVKDQLTNMFTSLQSAGLKCIFGIVYAGNDAEVNAFPHPSRAIMMGHMDQLQPIVNTYAYLIAGASHGFTGKWGEMQYWRGNDSFTGPMSHAETSIMLDRTLTFYPGHVMIRSCRNLFESSDADSNIGWCVAPITEAEAYGRASGNINLNGFVKGVRNFLRWKLTGHCDSAMNSGYDSGRFGFEAGTCWPEDGRASSSPRIVEQRKFWQDNAIWGPTYREGGTPNQFAGGPVTSGFTRLQAIEYLHKEHITWFNFTDSFSNMEAWMGGDDAESVRWRNTVGVRIWMKRFDLTVTANQVRATIDWQNEGSSGEHQPREFYVDLVSVANGQVYTIQMRDSNNGTDMRVHIPRGSSATKIVTLTATRPNGIPAGAYNIRIWMPDAAPQIKNDGRYAAPINSGGMTFSESNGRNDPGMRITVP